MKDPVDDVVEERAKTRFAVAQRFFVLLATNRNAGKLRKPRDEIELLGLGAARRIEIDVERAVDPITRRHDRRRATRIDTVLEQHAAELAPEGIGSHIARDDLPPERGGGATGPGFDTDRQILERLGYGLGQPAGCCEPQGLALDIEQEHRRTHVGMQLLDQPNDGLQRSLQRRIGRDELEHTAFPVT